jgi:uroporphyrinogen decarboxylase
VPDRIPLHDLYWGTTVDRWRREGLPEDVSPSDQFGMEIELVRGDYSLQFPEKTIEENDRHRVYVDSFGATKKTMLTSAGWTPQWLDFAIKTRDDWFEQKHRMAYQPSRVSRSAIEAFHRAYAKGKFLAFFGHGPFHATWQKVGMENLLMLMIEDREWVLDMFEAHTRLMIELLEGFKAQGIQFDGVWLADDLGFRSNPLISPRMYRDMVLPSHKRLCDRMSEAGLRTILHSDGNVAKLIPHFIEAGFAAIQPLESKAGLDVRRLKAEYGGQIVLFGNIDVQKLAQTRQDIESEIGSKISIAKEGGGYIYHSDHSVPDNVSFSNYTFAIEMVLKYGRY